MGKAAIQKPKQNNSGHFQNKWFYLDDWRAQLLLVVACVVCYGNTVFNEYSFDDDFAITHNEYIQKGLAGIPDILTHPYASTEDKVVDYRPLPAITFAIEHQFFGANPHVSHFFNIVLYSFCVCLVFILLKSVFGVQHLHSVLPLLIALFYAVHPSHTEVVASLKSRDEILSFVFVLSSFLFVFKFFTASDKLQIGYALGAFLFLGLSFISKMTAMPLIAIITLTGIYFGFHKEKFKFYLFSFLWVAFAITYISVVVYFLKRPTYDLENPLFFNNDFSIRLGTAFETLFFYFKFMLVPFPFRFYYGYNMIPLIPMSDSAAMVSFFIHLFLFSYGVWLFFRKQLLGLFILCYLLGLVLYSNFFGNFPGIVGERVLFSPSIWFIAALILFVFRLANFDKIKGAMTFFQKSFLILGAFVFVTYTWLTIQRNFQWKDKITLMAADIPHLTKSSLANYFYASSLLEQGQQSASDSMRYYYFNEAQKYYRQTIRVTPAYSEPYFQMGMLLAYQFQEYDSAFEYFYKAYSLDTTRYQASKSTVQFQLAKSYYLKNDYSEANKLFTDLYNKLPEDTFTLFFFARVKFLLGDTGKASMINQQLMNLSPRTFYPYLNQAYFLQQAGRFPEAVPLYEMAIKYGYRDNETINTMLNYYQANGLAEKISEMQRLVGY